MPGDVCVVCGKTRAKDKSVSLHRFPQDLARKQKWMEVFKLSESNIKAHTRVCSRHFPNADPTNSPQLTIGKRFASPLKLAALRTKRARLRAEKRALTNFSPPSSTPVSPATSLTPTSGECIAGPSTPVEQPLTAVIGIELHSLLLQIKCTTSNSEFRQLKLAAQCVGLTPRKLNEVHDISDLYSSLENAFGPDNAISILYLCLKEIKIDAENVRKLPVKEKVLENWRQEQNMKFALMVTGICNQIVGENCKRFIDLWKDVIPETSEDMETLFKHLFLHRVVWSEDVEKLKQVLGCMGNQVCMDMVEKYQSSIKL